MTLYLCCRSNMALFVAAIDVRNPAWDYPPGSDGAYGRIEKGARCVAATPLLTGIALGIRS
jgi:hypothetical protein